VAKANPDVLLAKNYDIIEADNTLFIVEDNFNSLLDYKRAFPDSAVSIFPLTHSTQKNAEKLNLPITSLTDTTKQTFQCIVIPMLKSKPEMKMMLAWSQANISDTGSIVVFGENNSGTKSLNNLVEHIDFAKVASGKHSLVMEARTVPTASFNLDDWWQSYEINDLTIFNLPGVFSHNKLDKGTTVILKHLPEKVGNNMLEFGCGSGVLAAHLLKAYPDTEFTTLDNQLTAVMSCKKTLSANGFDGRFEVLASDGLTEVTGKFNNIISNPPFHKGVGTEYSITEKFIVQAREHLKRNGELRIVCNEFLSYETFFDKAYKQVKNIVRTAGFKVITARHF
jgi:16S rRNA (guanine1207-N2)-methyltransferase